MIKLRVSYEHPEELQQLLSRLGPAVKHWKAARQKGRFKRAYVDLSNKQSSNEADE